MKGTNAFFLQRSVECTLPFGIDDPQQTSSSSKTNRTGTKTHILTNCSGVQSNMYWQLGMGLAQPVQ